MGTKYSTVTVSGYNASPPSDDGSTAATNQVKWSTQKSKLTDPLNTAIAAINSELVTALNTGSRSITTTDSTVAGDHMQTVEIASTVTVTFTLSLGDAATMASGYIVNVKNLSAVDITIGRVTIGDTINGTAANVTLKAGNGATFKVNASGNGYYTTDSPANLGTMATQTLGAVPGTNTNDNAAAGVVGEYISATVLAASAVSLTSVTPADVTSISLTAGDWDVSGAVVFAQAATTTSNLIESWISTASATTPTFPNSGAVNRLATTLTTGGTQVLPTGTIRISLAATTTIYLSCIAVFAVSTETAYGFIGARRAR